MQIWVAGFETECSPTIGLRLDKFGEVGAYSPDFGLPELTVYV